MAVTTKIKQEKFNIPVTLDQIAEGLRQLSKSELETIEMLLDKKVARIIKRSVKEVGRGRAREL